MFLVLRQTQRALNSITHTAHAQSGSACACALFASLFSGHGSLQELLKRTRYLRHSFTLGVWSSDDQCGFSTIDGNKPVAKLLDQLSSSDGLLVLQVLGPITVVLALLGLCAASLDTNLCFSCFALQFSALTFVEFVALIVVASPLIQIQAEMDSAVEEVFLNVTPLHKAETFIKQELNKLQTTESCCGLRSFEDWEDQLPASCLCTPPTPFPSSVRSAEVHNVSSVGSCVLAEKNWVHAKSCGPILKSYLSFPIKLRIGIISAVTTITIAAIALSLALGLENRWKSRTVETTVDDYNRVKYQPQPYLS
ncbi:hypothetical protein WMY93_022118 [Mugilogobius chulae]|uniref:Tetraspanin n=1 Tax=Mugilogobius chulae TaxID=88201 RepID=A0AAW0NPQ6_9GOBI